MNIRNHAYLSYLEGDGEDDLNTLTPELSGGGR
jgi:hypothetical protein